MPEGGHPHPFGGASIGMKSRVTRRVIASHSTLRADARRFHSCGKANTNRARIWDRQGSSPWISIPFGMSGSGRLLEMVSSCTRRISDHARELLHGTGGGHGWCTHAIETSPGVLRLPSHARRNDRDCRRLGLARCNQVVCKVSSAPKATLITSLRPGTTKPRTTVVIRGYRLSQ